jgi:hypothetical protein
VRERTLLEAALARLDDAALMVMRSAANEDEQHQILGSLVGAHSLLSALVRLDPAAVDELLTRAIRLARQVSCPRREVVGTPAGRLQEVGPASPTTTSTPAAEVDLEGPHAVGM